MKQQQNCQSGFTLIEITFVIVIAAIVLATGLSLWQPYFAQRQIDRTASAIKTAETALKDFVEKNGRYPCPAPLLTPRGNAADGAEQCTADGTNVIAADGQSYTGSPAPQVVSDGILIGAIPYRTLNIPVDATIDAYANRITYAVSDASTDDATYDDLLSLTDHVSSAAILVVDDGGNSIAARDLDGVAGDEVLFKDFFLFSHGSNGAGAVSNDGIASAAVCAPGSRESVNCDGDGTFIAAARSLGTNPEYNDDVSNESLLINSDGGNSLWARATGNRNNIYNVNSQNVGVGTDDPRAKLDVDGEIKISNSALNCNSSAEGALRYNPSIKQMEFCNGTVWGSFSNPRFANIVTNGPITTTGSQALNLDPQALFVRVDSSCGGYDNGVGVTSFGITKVAFKDAADNTVLEVYTCRVWSQSHGGGAYGIGSDEWTNASASAVVANPVVSTFFQTNSIAMPADPSEAARIYYQTTTPTSTTSVLYRDNKGVSQLIPIPQNAVKLEAVATNNGTLPSRITVTALK